MTEAQDICVGCKKPLRKNHPDHSRFISRNQRTRHHPKNTVDPELRYQRCDDCYIKALHDKKLAHNKWRCIACRGCTHTFMVERCPHCLKHARELEMVAKDRNRTDKEVVKKR